VRTVTLYEDEYEGTDLLLTRQTAISPHPELEREDECHRCTRAGKMEEIWNQFKDPHAHVAIIHCIVCDRVILKLSHSAYKQHHPPEHCQAHYHEDNDNQHHPHHRHEQKMGTDRTGCQPLLLNKSTSIQAQIDEGGNPFGNISQEVKPCFENSTMLQTREDHFGLKPGEKSDKTRAKPPRELSK